MYASIFFGLVLTRSHSGCVTVFTVIDFSLLILWTYRWTLPLRTKRSESLQESGYIFVFCVSSGYPNPIKQELIHFYPLITPVPDVDV